MNPAVDSSLPPPPASSDAEVAAFLIAPTPRRDIPPKIAREAHAQLAPTSILSGSIMTIVFGILIIIAMLVMASRFAVLRDAALTRKHETATGVVLSVESETNRKATVYKFSFVFTPAGAGSAQVSEKISGVCYADESRWKKDEQVVIEYNPEDATIARIQGSRLRKFATSSWFFLFCGATGPLMLGAGIWGIRRFFKLRARCRWLLENGAVGEFLVVDVDIGRQEQGRDQRAILIYDFQLEPANWKDYKHSYSSRLTKENQYDYAEAVRRSKTTTFGLYDPTGTATKRQVLMVEAWFYTGPAQANGRGSWRYE